MDFGRDALFITLVAGNGSTGFTTIAEIDNFTATGTADTDPLYDPIPEPTTVVLIGLGLISIVLKKYPR